MKKILTVLLLVFLLISCQKNVDDCDQKNAINYKTLDNMARSLTPYFRDSVLDTIYFLNNNGDTAIFNLVLSDSLWFIKIDNSNPDCINKRQDWYQILHKKYLNNFSGDQLELYHSLKKEIDQLPKYGGPFEMSYPFELYLNNHHHTFYDGTLVNPKQKSQYYGNLIIGTKVYVDVIYTYNNMVDSLTSKAFFNKEFGLLKFEDRINNTTWTILNP